MFCLLQRTCALVVITSCFASTARADTLTRDRVIELARKRAPDVRIAETRVGEARGRLVGARVLLPENPVIDAVVGPRWSDEQSIDTEVELAVPVQIGGQRGKRIAVATAGVDRDTRLATDAQRLAVGVALAAYYEAVHAKARVELSQARKSLAEDLLATANERRKAGDATQLEVNLASSEVARAESEILSEQASFTRARADLAKSLGLTTIEGLDVEGRLDDRTWFDQAAAMAAVQRADVRAAEAELAGARSEVALADVSRVPDVSLRLSYKHEDVGTNILMGGLAISLPFFERGQGARAESRARRDRAAVELEAKRGAATVEVEAAREAYASAVSAAKTLEERGLPVSVQNEAMSRESYRVGKIDLSTLLVIRREALDTRREYLERLLEAAVAGVQVRVAMGAL